MRTAKELFNEIVKLASSVGQETEVEAQEEKVHEDVVLSEEQPQAVSEDVDLVEDAPVEQMPDEETPKGDYVTRAEYESTVRELKEMYEKVLEVVSPVEGDDVPADLSSDKQKVELNDEVEGAVEEDAAVEAKPEPAADDLVHTPDANVEKKQMYLYGQQRAKTTQDYVFTSIFNKK